MNYSNFDFSISLLIKQILPNQGQSPHDRRRAGSEHQTHVNTLEVNGTVVANEYVELHPEASGRLTYLFVPEGKLIKKGTLIAKVNNADLEAQVQKSKVALDLAMKTEQRDKQLLAVNGINQADYDAALNVVNGFKADIEYNQALLDKTILKAPFDGFIGLRQVSMQP